MSLKATEVEGVVAVQSDAPPRWEGANFFFRFGSARPIVQLSNGENLGEKKIAVDLPGNPKSAAVPAIYGSIYKKSTVLILMLIPPYDSEAAYNFGFSKLSTIRFSKLSTCVFFFQN